jgi:hypothetical protein
VFPCIVIAHVYYTWLQTTVGYGDKVPITQAGRAFAYIWLFMGIVFFALLSAELAAALKHQVPQMNSYAPFRSMSKCVYPMYNTYLQTKDMACNSNSNSNSSSNSAAGPSW